MTDKAAIAEAIDIEALMRQATQKAEKASKLSPVFLRRDSFAGSSASTGSLCLDWKVGGGIPPGRIVGISGPERSGKTLLVTQILFNQLCNNNFSTLYDAEGSTDPLFLQARKINFNKFRGKRDKNGDLRPKEVDHFNMYQPTTVEELTEYIHTLSSNLPENRNPTHPICIHALDSVVALITDALDEDIDANKMAFHARMYAQYLPIINSDLVKSGCTLIYTNQLRQKPGVTYGCLFGETPIHFADGRIITIKEVVNQKIEGDVWSYVNGKIKPAKIINWYNNGENETNEWIQIKTVNQSVVVTKNHKVLCLPTGTDKTKWIEAKNLKIGDILVSKSSIDDSILYAKVVEMRLVKAIHDYNKYDLEIENSHNYLAGHGGLIVHNSPIYEPAGDALKFFSSMRLMLSTTKPKLSEEDHPFLDVATIPGVDVKQGGVWEEPHINEKGETIGIDKYVYTGIKTVKNKVYTPYQSCWIRIQFEENGFTGSGLDPVFDIFTFLYETGYIVPCMITNEKSGKEKRASGIFSGKACKQFNPMKEFNLPVNFNYYEFKKWVASNPDITMQLRDRMLVSGLVYEKEVKVIEEEIDDEVLEEAALDEVALSIEEVKKPRGRPPKA